jgi:hypothetical protein
MALQSVLSGWCFTAWWLLCGLLALASVILAALEAVTTWRGLRAGQIRCLRAQREEIERSAPLDPRKQNPPSSRPLDD